LPGTIKKPLENNLAGWMLLSFSKRATASSILENRLVENAFDEDIRTVWSAKTGGKGEFLAVDLENISNINAVQINFAEQDAVAKGRRQKTYQQYVLEISDDGKQWKTLVDESQNERDVPHDYIEPAAPAKARYIKLTNLHQSERGKFSVRDLRVFGRSIVTKPTKVKNLIVKRNPNDGRKAIIKWHPSPNAFGYNISFGISPKKLYSTYQVNQSTSIVMNGLNKDVKYFFTVEAFNESGISKKSKIISANER
jgi:hypothetical protein